MRRSRRPPAPCPPPGAQPRPAVANPSARRPAQVRRAGLAPG
ncbi:hypothetical protein APASM_4439 [Actinosynnema pretiosum subsp. pretiosum]|nr:hypothetical protein APASM_4439 [Actinosynnema pretiosum subsp. pretiosum]